MTFCAEHFTFSIFGTINTTAVTTAVAVVVVVALTLTRRYNAGRGYRTGSNDCSFSCVQHARNIMKVVLNETHARGAQVRYVTPTYVWLFGEESACTTRRWAFGCSDPVMVNILIQ